MSITVPHGTVLLCCMILVFQFCSSAKIGIVTCPDKSHTFTFTKVAKELIKHGHEVHFCIRDHDYSGENSSGINYHVIQNWFTKKERQELREYLTTLDLVSAELEDTDWMFKDYEFFLKSSCVTYLKQQKIDLFLFEPLYIANYLLLQQLNVPSLALSTNSLYDPILSYIYGSQNSLSSIPQTSSGLTNKLSFFGRVLNIATWAVDYVYLQYYMLKLSNLAQSYDLLPFTDPASKFGRQILLVPLQIGFEYPRQVASNVMYIGPISPQDPEPLQIEFENVLAPYEKAILVSFGTTFFHPSLINVVRGLENFARQMNEINNATLPRYQVLVQFSSMLLPRFQSVLRESKYVRFFPWVPQLELLAHPKVELFISHCGVNGIMESLYFGKPILGIPLIHDQEENAIKVVASGTGLQLSKYSSTLVQEVQHSTNQILTDKSFKSNAIRISKLLRHAGPLRGASAVVHWAEYTLNVGAEHLVTPYVISGGLSTVALYNLDVAFVFVCLVLLVKYLYSYWSSSVQPIQETLSASYEKP